MAERKSAFGENGVVVDAAAFEPYQKQARVTCGPEACFCADQRRALTKRRLYAPKTHITP